MPRTTRQFTVPFIHMGLTLQVPFAYYTVELAAGDVSEAILTDSWTAKRKLEVFRGMCRAVQRAHSQSIAHRDLKPGNFLFMSDGSIRLSDFGTARDLADPTGAVLGKYTMPPGDRTYTAPEMLGLLHDVDSSYALRADVYSLGVILFEIFSGTPLFFQIFDWSLVADLQSTMSAVDRSGRVQTYEAFIGALADRATIAKPRSVWRCDADFPLSASWIDCTGPWPQLIIANASWTLTRYFPALTFAFGCCSTRVYIRECVNSEFVQSVHARRSKP